MNLKSLECSQAELADLAGVDRTTIRNYQKHGLPHAPQRGKGQECKYVMPVAIHWIGAYGYLRRLHKPSLKPLEMVLLGHALGNCDFISFAEWRAQPETRRLAKRLSATDGGYESAIAFLVMADLLPQEWDCD